MAMYGTHNYTIPKGRMYFQSAASGTPTKSTPASGTAEAGNAGNGTMGTCSAGADPFVGTYTITCIDDSVGGAEIWQVATPSGLLIAQAVTAVAYTSLHINFTIAAGTNPFAAGDIFTLVVSIAAGSVASFLDFGNVSDIKITPEVEVIEHFSGRAGIKSKDKEIISSIKAKISFTLDELSPENMLYWCLGDVANSDVQAGGSAVDEDVVADHDRAVQLVYHDISSVVVKNSAKTVTYVLNTDYVYDAAEGLLTCLSTGSITDAQALKVSYAYATITRQKINFGSRSTKVEGHVKIVGDPAYGRKLTIHGYITVKPSGDLALISDELAKISMEGEFVAGQGYGDDVVDLFELFDRGYVS